jgi:co-chaperonin GroES (HSP10)
MSVSDPSGDSIIFADDKQTIEGITSYIPTGNRIIGKIINDPRKEKILKSGLILPNDILGGKDPYITVTAIRVGRGTMSHNGIVPNEVHPGDICLVFNGKWYELKEKDEIIDGKAVPGDSFVIFSENDIVALYKDRDQKKE